MRNFNLLLLFFNTLFYLGAQSACHTEHDSLVYDDKNYQYCDLPEMYLSNYLLDKRGVTKYDQSPIYTVNVKVHVIQYSTADPRNYTEADTMYLREAIALVNHKYANLAAPSIPVISPLIEETDSRVRFKLKEIADSFPINNI